MNDDTYLDEMRGHAEYPHPCYNQTGSLQYSHLTGTEYINRHSSNPGLPPLDNLSSKQAEYIQRGLPHTWKDGRVCQCRECKEAASMGLSSKQAVKDEYRWVDVPFWFAWTCWSVAAATPVGISMSIEDSSWHNLHGLGSAITFVLTTLAVGLLVTAVTKYGHEYLGWFGGATKGRVVKCNSSYTNDEYVIKRDPPGYYPDLPSVNVGEAEETEAHRKCKGYYLAGDMQAYEKCIVDEYWREADARNGLHRQDKLINTDAIPTPIKRGSGLHRFTLTIGWSHEREE